jgi:hypothetical protein
MHRALKRIVKIESHEMSIKQANPLWVLIIMRIPCGQTLKN